MPILQAHFFKKEIYLTQDHCDRKSQSAMERLREKEKERQSKHASATCLRTRHDKMALTQNASHIVLRARQSQPQQTSDGCLECADDAAWYLSYAPFAESAVTRPRSLSLQGSLSLSHALRVSLSLSFTISESHLSLLAFKVQKSRGFPLTDGCEARPWPVG